MTPTASQVERIRRRTLDGLPASRIAIYLGMNSKAVTAVQRGLGLDEIAAANARRFKVAALRKAVLCGKHQPFGLHVDMGPSPAGDFVRLPRPADLPTATLRPSTGHGPRVVGLQCTPPPVWNQCHEQRFSPPYR